MNWMLLLLLAAESSPFAELEWALMGGRATDIEGVPGDPRIVYAAAASGGVWKTTDGGVKWKPIFDEQPVASIGDIAREPGNPAVLYVGTGEANLRNSVSFGNGATRSYRTSSAARMPHPPRRSASISTSSPRPMNVEKAKYALIWSPSPRSTTRLRQRGSRSFSCLDHNSHPRKRF